MQKLKDTLFLTPCGIKDTSGTLVVMGTYKGLTGLHPVMLGDHVVPEVKASLSQGRHDPHTLYYLLTLRDIF